jgi:uncharacterized RDD family membrane protein YckC
MTMAFEQPTPETPAPAPAQMQSIRDISKLPGVIDRANPLGHYAGFTTRLIAFLIDQAIVLTILFIIGTAAQLLQDTLPLGAATKKLLTLSVAAGGLIFYVLYFLVFWILAGQTPGKKFMGVRIVGADGARINTKQAVARFIGCLISLILFLGYLWVLVDNRRQGWHDHLAHTLVVYSWPETPKVTHAPLDDLTFADGESGVN